MRHIWFTFSVYFVLSFHLSFRLKQYRRTWIGYILGIIAIESFLSWFLCIFRTLFSCIFRRNKNKPTTLMLECDVIVVVVSALERYLIANFQHRYAWYGILSIFGATCSQTKRLQSMNAEKPWIKISMGSKEGTVSNFCRIFAKLLWLHKLAISSIQRSCTWIFKKNKQTNNRNIYMYMEFYCIAIKNIM